MRRFIGLLLLPMALFLTVPVHATAPTLVTGTIRILTVATTEVQTADGNTIFTVSFRESVTGGIDGTNVGNEIEILHSTGQVSATAESTFTGTINGSGPGSASMTSAAQGTVFPGGSSFQGQTVIGYGAGGLAGIHGEGNFTGSGLGTGTVATYVIQVHFDPA